MPLRDQVVDVFLTGPDQLPSSHQGGLGRLTEARNATFPHFDPASATQAQHLNLVQRKGMRSLSLTGHSASASAATTPSWSGPRLLTTTGAGAPLGVYRSKPRVYDGTDWTTYETNRVVTNKTTARPVYSSQSVAQAPDTSWLGGVQARVWTEVTQGSNLSDTAVTTIVVGFRADNGSWVRPPFALKAGTVGSDGITMARVVNDGTQFWVFAVDHNGGSPKLNMYVYDTNGKQLATSTALALKWTVFEPGYWDVQRKPSSSVILVAQPNGTDPDADNHVEFTQCTYAASTVTLTTNVDAALHCNGPIAWATNFQDNFNYLLTTNFDTGTTVRLYGYRIELTIDGYVGTHTYDYGITIPVTPDTLIGYTEASTDATPAHKNLVTSFGVPAIASAYGAAYDPALRYTKSYLETWAGVTSLLRETNGVCQVSRAFVIDDDYYAWTYYQSGSGESVPTVDDITLTVDDYMLGAPEQPFDVTFLDYAVGSPQLFAGTSVFTTNAQVAGNIIAGDTVQNTVAPAGIAIPAGTAVLKWTLTNSTGGAFTVGSRLDINGNTDYPAVNTGMWTILSMGGAGPSNVFYTQPSSTVGGTVPDITFTTSGTSTVVSMTKYAMDVASIYNFPRLRDFLENGTMVVTGSAVGANNGTKTIDNAVVDGVWIVTGTEGTSATGFTATLTPGFANLWAFNNLDVDDSLIGSFLKADNTLVAGNVGTFEITGIVPAHGIETDNETTLLPQYFSPPVDSATAAIVLDPAAHPYTFYIQSVTFDYTYLNAIISLSNTTHPDNTGLYKIIQIVDDHTVYTVPVSTLGPVKNESLLPDTQDLSILKASATFPQVQPQWFITPLGDVTTSQVGNLELGLAYADWRREAAVSEIGDQNPYLLHVSTPCLDLDGYTTTLPFRAVTVTEQSPTVIGGNVSTSAITANVVGIKEFKLYSATFGTANNGIIPGPMAAAYDGGQFMEAGILIGAEQPTLESEDVSSNPAALKPNATYSYVACWEAIDGKGNRIWTAPSPALEVILSGDNNSATISGRLPIPLSSSGINLISSKHYGLSNRPMIVLSIYRTCIQNGLQTTAHYKITDDLAPNATVPVSASNNSGFAFPDEFTWTYTDENLDSVVLANEKLYTDRGLLPRFHPPAFHNGATGWQERDWLNAYDGAIWFSGEGAEGEASWYTPLFRVPAPFEPTAIGNLESFLAGFALDSKWYLPNFKPPLNNGTLLSDVPAWQRLPLEGGCTGVVLPIRGGLAYASNFGGVWFLSRALQDEWTSRDMIDSLDGKTISSMAVDSKQRLHVLTNSTDWFCFDQIARRWSRWIIGDPFGPRLATVSNGVVYWASTTCVGYYDQTLTRDIVTTIETGTPLGFTLAGLNFANVTGIKKLRLIQLRGQYKGTHKVAMSVSYPDQNATAPTTTMTLFTPDSSKPYVLDAYPKTEEASSYGVVVDADFTGVATPGDSFELDVIGALVAVSGKAGTNRSTQQISNG